MGFFDVVGDIINPKNLLTAGGFALGGPAGAAIGRGIGGAAFGGNWDPTDDGSLGERLGSGVKGAGEGYLMGAGGEALGLGGGATGAAKAATPTTAGELAANSAPAGPLAAGGGLPAGSMATPTSFAGGGSAGLGPLAGVAGGTSSSPVVTAGAPAAAVPEASGGGGFLSDIGGWFGQMEPFEQAYIGLQGLGAVGNTVSAISDASLAKRRRERMERLAKLLQPYFAQNLQATQQSFDAPPIFDQNRGY